MNSYPSDNLLPPRWLTLLAWATVAVVCPLLFLGALVTTMGVGMADQRPMVRTPFQSIYEMLFGDRQDAGFRVEHIHRLAGWLAGLCGILLAISSWFFEPRRGYRWLGLLAVTLIGVQGMLGYYRVAFNALIGPNLAWIHGCFGQIVFAILVGVALAYSPSWRLQPAQSAAPGRLRGWSLLCLGLVFMQLAAGGHDSPSAGPGAA